MLIIGCDFHTRYQQIAMPDEATGELVERRLEHETGEARAFYTGLVPPVRVGIGADGHTQWFERMLTEMESVCRGTPTHHSLFPARFPPPDIVTNQALP